MTTQSSYGDKRNKKTICSECRFLLNDNALLFDQMSPYKLQVNNFMYEQSGLSRKQHKINYQTLLNGLRISVLLKVI
jgi:hypothetical protein